MCKQVIIIQGVTDNRNYRVYVWKQMNTSRESSVGLPRGFHLSWVFKDEEELGRQRWTCQCSELPKVTGSGLAADDERQFWEGEPHFKVQQVVINPGGLVSRGASKNLCRASHRPTEPTVVTFPLARKSGRWFKWAVRVEGCFYSRWRTRKGLKGRLTGPNWF